MVSFKMRLKNVGQTPRKIGEVTALIRRRSIDDALVILDHTPRRAAGSLTKLLKNAQATARRQHRLKTDSLLIEEVFVTAGQHLPIRARTGVRAWRRSRILPYRRRRSHVYLTIKGEAAAKPKPVATKSQSVKNKGGNHGSKS